MNVLQPLVSLCACFALLAFVSCSKKEEGSASTPEASAGRAAVEETSGEEGNPVLQIGYKESIRAGFENLALTMSFVDEQQEAQEWKGTLTIVKDRFATVERRSDEQKVTHLRNWSEVHIVDIPESGQPAVDRTEPSPLINKRFIVDRLDDGSWKHHLENVPRGQALSPDVAKMIAELDRLESATAMFYEGKRLAVGESWQVPVEGVTRWFGNMIEELSGDVNVRVDREGSMQEQACIVLAVDLDVAGKIRDPDGQSLEVQLSGSGEIWRARELGLDLKTDIAGDAELGVSVEANQISMRVQGPLKIAEERTLVQ